MDAPSIQTFIQSKVTTPPVGAEILPRERLYLLLDQVREKKCAIVTGGGGYGKSTLVAGWLKSRNLKAAWLSLDADDNDPKHYHDYVIESLIAYEGNISQTLRNLREALGDNYYETILGVAFKLFAEQNTDLFLVLDDYHLITNPVLHDNLMRELEYFPPNFHLVIISREELPVKLNRFRSRGQLIDITFEDLRFSKAELGAFLSDKKHIQFSDEWLNKLEAETEGWMAAVQLYLLRQRRQTEAPPATQLDLTRKHAIFEYLSEEVFEMQTAEIKRFLMQISAMQRFNAALLQTATEAENAVVWLQYLIKHNLFVVPIDEAGNWYRLHQLFGEFLSAKREIYFTQEEINALYIRVGDWYLRQSVYDEAIKNYALARDYNRMADIVESQIEDLIGNSRIPLLRAWLNLFPAHFSEKRPRLQAFRISVAFQENDYLQTEDLSLRMIQQALDGRFDDEPETRRYILGYCYRMLATLNTLRSDTRHARHFMRLADQCYPPEVERGALFAHNQLYNLSICLMEEGNYDTAIASFQTLIHQAQQSRYCAFITGPSYYLAQMYHARGRTEDAIAVLNECARIVKPNETSYSLIHLPILLKAQFLIEQNRLSEAEATVTESEMFANLDIQYLILVYQHPILVRIYELRGQFDRAIALLNKDLDNYPNTNLHTLNEARLAQMNLHANRIDALEPWLQTNQNLLVHLPNLPLNRFQELNLRVVLRWAVMTRQFEISMDISNHLLQFHRRARLTPPQIETLLLQATALHGAGQEEEASAVTRQAVELAYPSRLARLFGLENKAVLTPMLVELQQSGLFVDFITEILRIFKNAGAETGGAAKNLSDRELEVLELLEKGLSMKQLAEKLFVTTGTIKRHIHNIGQKLDAHSRAEILEAYRKMRPNAE